MSQPPLLVHSAPFLKGAATTPSIMRDVVAASLVVTLSAFAVFGLSALLVVGATTLGAVLTEYVLGGRRRGSLRDWSALLTGILLGLTLPPGIPLWMALLGGAAAIGLGKAVWGGLGQNLFNPALVGRAFLQAAFPTAITTWSAQGQPALALRASNFAWPLMAAPEVDAITTATPLGLMKFDHEATPLVSLLVGDTAGSLGETSALLLVVCGAWLVVRRAFDWRIPVGIVATVGALSAVVHLAAPASFPTPWFMCLSGGLLFGAVFMATDPVSSPMSPRGTWVFAAGIGVLVVLIRLWGGLPEGVMYAILLMNAATPLLNRALPTRPFGRGGRR